MSQQPPWGKVEGVSMTQVELDVKRRELHGLIRRSRLAAQADTPAMLRVQLRLKQFEIHNLRAFGRVPDYRSMIRNRLMPGSAVAWRIVNLPRE